jgi:hypothetical protein
VGGLHLIKTYFCCCYTLKSTDFCPQACYNDIVVDAWNRAFNAIISLKWTPAAVEAPIAKFDLFPTAGSKAKRELSMLIEVNLYVSDYNADLPHGVDESYTLDITANSQSIDITAKPAWAPFRTVMEVFLLSSLCLSKTRHCTVSVSWSYGRHRPELHQSEEDI